jgi:hypothetical protein
VWEGVVGEEDCGGGGTNGKGRGEIKSDWRREIWGIDES